MGFIAFGADEARLLKSSYPLTTTSRSPARSLADDNAYVSRGQFGSPWSWDEDCESGNWLETIDQTKITQFDLTWASDDLEIDDGI